MFFERRHSCKETLKPRRKPGPRALKSAKSGKRSRIHASLVRDFRMKDAKNPDAVSCAGALLSGVRAKSPYAAAFSDPKRV